MDSQLRSEVIFRADIAQMLTAILSAAAGSDAVYNFGFFSAIRAVSIAYDVLIPGLDEERERLISSIKNEQMSRLALRTQGGGGNV